MIKHIIIKIIKENIPNLLKRYNSYSRGTQNAKYTSQKTNSSFHNIAKAQVVKN